MQLRQQRVSSGGAHSHAWLVPAGTRYAERGRFAHGPSSTRLPSLSQDGPSHVRNTSVPGLLRRNLSSRVSLRIMEAVDAPEFAPEQPLHKLLRADALDWVCVACLIVIGASVEAAPPFRRTLFPDELWRLKLPLVPNTVPSWSVPVVAFLVPTFIFVATHATRRASFDKKTLARLILGLFGACSVTFCVTNVLKVAVGRPRPDFVARCWPDGQVSGLPGVPVCEGENNAHIVKDGMKSWPSGHSSLTTAGMVYLSLFLWTRVLFTGAATAQPRTPVARVLLALLPIAFALYVAVTRVRDGWHFWSDVASGALLGGSMAWLFYHAVAPPAAPKEDRPRGPDETHPFISVNV